MSWQRTNKAVEDMDRLQIHDKLRRAEGRVAALEKELLDNTRRWARDKAELQVKFSGDDEVIRLVCVHHSVPVLCPFF